MSRGRGIAVRHLAGPVTLVRMGMKRRPGAHAITVKRAHDAPDRSDGCRVLVDRIWPRGVSREAAALDGWIKDVAPSTELRRWFGHDPARWDEFKRRYFDELADRPGPVGEVLATCSGGTLTLVFGAKDRDHNNAVALREYLERHRRRRR